MTATHPTHCAHCRKELPAVALIVIDSAAFKVWCSLEHWARDLEAARDAGSEALAREARKAAGGAT